MKKVYPNHFYMRISEDNIKRDGSQADFEPDFSYNDLILVGDRSKIKDETDLLNTIEDILFEKNSSQIEKGFFKRETNDFGYLYTANLVYDDTKLVKQSDSDYTITTTLEVEVNFYPEISLGAIRWTL